MCMVCMVYVWYVCMCRSDQGRCMCMVYGMVYGMVCMCWECQINIWVWYGIYLRCVSRMWCVWFDMCGVLD